MTYFNYHAKIKQKIKKGELISYYFEQNYNKIGFCLVLCFIDKKYPIREYRFNEYFDLIGQLYSTNNKNGIYYTNIK